MSKRTFNLIALNSDYEIVSLLRYTNLQWSRKYYEAGTFSVQIPLEQYDSSIKYVYTKDRPELGKVNQINYASGSGYKYVQLSGYFLENEVDRMICYPNSTTNVTDAPTWVTKTGKLEDIALYFFSQFKSVTTGTYTSTLDIEAGESKSMGDTHTIERGTEAKYLGTRIHEILSLEEMSFKVSYDFESSKKVFSVYKGLDRTEENVDGNNPVIFSSKYGNIKDPNVLIDNTNYRNAEMVFGNESSNNVTTYYMRAIWNREAGTSDSSDCFQILNASLNKSDYSSASEWFTAMETEGYSDLSTERIQTVNVEFDAAVGSYDYMVDFDIGDKCNIEIAELGLSAEARLIGCYEVIKSGEWTLTLEFGTPVLNK